MKINSNLKLIKYDFLHILPHTSLIPNNLYTYIFLLLNSLKYIKPTRRTRLINFNPFQ